MAAKDPQVLSGRHADEALRRVHAEADVPGDAPLDAHADPKVPGANFVDGSDDVRFWVGLRGEVVRTGSGTTPPTASPAYREARNQYTAAVERVRLHYSTPVVEELFALPDTHVPGAFLVYDTGAPQTVRWLSPDGEVHGGYRLVDDVAHWDERTVAARRAQLERIGSTVPPTDH